MKKRYSLFFVVILALIIISGCSMFGATNITSTNIGVATYESAGAVLTQAYNTEKALLKARKISALQDEAFQMGVYKKAIDCYKAVGSAAVVVLTATDAVSKATAQNKFNVFNAQLPALIAEVLKFIEEVKK